MGRLDFGKFQVNNLWQQGIWNTERGIELPLVYLVIAAVIGSIGPGRYSLDATLGLMVPQPAFLVAVALVVVGVIASLYTGQLIARQEHGQKTKA